MRSIFLIIVSLIATSSVNEIKCQQANGNISEPISKVIKLEGNTLHLDNGKKLIINGLNDPQKQIVIIINHTQEDSIGLDPGLTYMGNRRAYDFMRLVKNAEIKNIYSILFRRTVLTARPMVKESHVPIKHYDPGQIDYLTKNYFKKNIENSIVIGTPTAVVDLLQELSPDTSYPNFIKNPYDYIYIVEMDKDKEPIIHSFTY